MDLASPDHAATLRLPRWPGECGGCVTVSFSLHVYTGIASMTTGTQRGVCLILSVGAGYLKKTMVSNSGLQAHVTYLAVSLPVLSY